MALPPLRSLKRSILGMSYNYANDYKFINCFKGPSFGGSGMGYRDTCDEQGWVNTSGKQSASGSISFSLPSTVSYGALDGEYYVLTGQGDGDVQFRYPEFTIIGTPSGVTHLGGANFRVKHQNNHTPTDAVPQWRIVLRKTDHTAPAAMSLGYTVVFTNSDYDNGGFYLKNVAMYRITDEASFRAGQTYRNAYLDQIIEMNPSFVRFQAPNGVLTLDAKYRFRDRTPYNYLVYGAGNGIVNCTMGVIKYNDPTMTPGVAPVYSVAAVAGQTTANMKHGEVAEMHIGTDWATSNGTVPASGSGSAIAAITKAPVVIAGAASTPVVTTTFPKTYHAGDKIFLYNFFSGMAELHQRIVTITAVIDPTHFAIDVDTSGFSTYVSEACCAIPIYLKVGTGGNRGGPDGNGYPVFQYDARTPSGINQVVSGDPLYNMAGTFGGNDGYGWNNLRTFWFDKTLIGSRNGDGSINWGLWVSSCAFGISTYQGNQSTMPIEEEAIMINELEARIITTGQQATKGPINPWVCMPIHATCKIDPDYDPLDDYGLGIIDIMINGSPHNAPIPSRCRLMMEYSNEVFNFGALSNMFCSAHTYSRYDGNSYPHGAQIRQNNLLAAMKTAHPTLFASTKIMSVMCTWPHGFSGKPGDSTFIGGLGVFGGGDMMVHGTADWMEYMNNAGTHRVPPGSDPNIWPFDPNARAITNWSCVSPGAYTIPSNDWYATQFQQNAAAYAAAGRAVNIVNVVPNANNPYWSDITTDVAHTFAVGNLVIPTDIQGGIDGGGDNTTNWFENNPARVVYSNMAAKTLTINLDCQASRPWSGSCTGKIMHFQHPDQEAPVTAFNYWLLDPDGLNWVAGVQYNGNNGATWAKKVFENARDQMALYAPNVLTINYEGWTQINVGTAGAVAGATQGQARAFTKMLHLGVSVKPAITYYCNIAKDNEKCLGMSVLTIVADTYYGWGVYPRDSYGLVQVNGAEWTGPNPLFEGLSEFNSLPQFASGNSRAINWSP